MTVNGSRRHRAVSEGFLNGGGRFPSGLGRTVRLMGWEELLRPSLGRTGRSHWAILKGREVSKIFRSVQFIYWRRKKAAKNPKSEVHGDEEGREDVVGLLGDNSHWKRLGIAEFMPWEQRGNCSGTTGCDPETEICRHI